MPSSEPAEPAEPAKPAEPEPFVESPEDAAKSPMMLATDQLMDCEAENNVISVEQLKRLHAYAAANPRLAKVKAFYDDLLAKVMVEESAKYSAAEREEYLEAHEFKQRSIKLRNRANLASGLMRVAG